MKDRYICDCAHFIKDGLSVGELGKVYRDLIPVTEEIIYEPLPEIKKPIATPMSWGESVELAHEKLKKFYPKALKCNFKIDKRPYGGTTADVGQNVIHIADHGTVDSVASIAHEAVHIATSKVGTDCDDVYDEIRPKIVEMRLCKEMRAQGYEFNEERIPFRDLDDCCDLHYAINRTITGNYKGLVRDSFVHGYKQLCREFDFNSGDRYDIICHNLGHMLTINLVDKIEKGEISMREIERILCNAYRNKESNYDTFQKFKFDDMELFKENIYNFAKTLAKEKTLCNN